MDVLGIREDGYHEVATVMQQISLFDDIEILWKERSPEEQNELQDGSKLNIRITTNKKFLPTDRSNLAYKAALIMEQKAMEMGRPVSGDLQIDIFKRIPVAAGLAGGSGNGFCSYPRDAGTNRATQQGTGGTHRL